MEYTISQDSHNQRINVKVTCLLGQDIRKKILTEVANLLYISGYKRVLIDLTKSSFNKAEPMIGALELSVHMKAIGISPQVKMAFIFLEAEAHRKYFESVANISGFNIRYFKNQQAAIKWLSQ